MSNTPRRARPGWPGWKVWLIGAVTLLLLWWFFRGLDLRQVGRAIADSRLEYLLLTLLVTIHTYVIRAWRWQQLLVPIGRARYRVAFRTTVIGFAATFLLPARVGEVLRPYLLARSEGLSATAVFATVVIERALDLASVLLLFAVFALTTSIDVGRTVEVGAAVVAALSLAGLVGMVVMAGHPERLGRWAGRLATVLPGRLGDLAGRLVRAFATGLAVMRRPWPLFVATVHSIVLWLSIALGVWLASQALDVTFAFTGSFLVLVFLVVGVAAPTPAGMGTFHWAYWSAVTTFFAADSEQAAAAAIVLHAITVVPVALAGLAFMAHDGLTLGGLAALPSESTPGESPSTVRRSVGEEVW